MTDWTDDDDAKFEAACREISGRKGERIVRALDILGWMIVPKPEWGNPGARWPTTLEPQDCPAWAESVAEEPKPKLRLIKGGKNDDAG